MWSMVEAESLVVVTKYRHKALEEGGDAAGGSLSSRRYWWMAEGDRRKGDWGNTREYNTDKDRCPGT